MSGFINKSQNTISVIEEILEKVKNDNDTINMNIDFIENTKQTTEFNPKKYIQDIQFIRQTSDYNVKAFNSKFFERKIAFDNAKTSVATDKAKLD